MGIGIITATSSTQLQDYYLRQHAEYSKHYRLGHLSVDLHGSIEKSGKPYREARLV